MCALRTAVIGATCSCKSIPVHRASYCPDLKALPEREPGVGWADLELCCCSPRRLITDAAGIVARSREALTVPRCASDDSTPVGTQLTFGLQVSVVYRRLSGLSPVVALRTAAECGLACAVAGL